MSHIHRYNHQSRNRCVVFILLVIACFGSLPGIVACQPAVPPTLSPVAGVVLPCRVVNNLPLAQVKVNNSRPLNFIVDTGATVSVISEQVTRELKLVSAEGTDVLTQGGSINANYIDGVQLGFAEATAVRLPPTTVVALDLDGASAGLGERIDGILGADLFEHYVVELNYVDRQLRLFDSAAYTGQATGETLPLTFIDRTPFIKATLTPLGDGGGKTFGIEASLLVDTGATNAVSLTTPFVRQHDLLKTAGKTIGITAGALVAGSSTALTGRLSDVRLGNLKIERPVANFSQDTQGDLASDEYSGVVGGEILRRYRIVIDYERARISFNPLPAAKSPYEATVSGISLVADANDFHRITVRAVIAASPATEAGVQVADEIVSINGVAAKDLTLENVRQQLRQTGKTFVIIVTRPGGGAGHRQHRTLRLKTRQLL